MRPGALVRLARAGTRTDTLRAALTALSAALATLALLAAVTVTAIGHPALGGRLPRYTSALLGDAGLRPGVAFTLLLLTIPVLALAGQCARLGGPARDRRLAAVRLAGGTPRQAVVSLAVAETGTASLAGSVLGLAAYLVTRQLLDDPDRYGVRPLPTDVSPPAWLIVPVVVAVPLLASVAAAVALRRVVTTPLGVSRRVRPEGSPRPWPALLLGVGVAAFTTALWTARAESEPRGLIVLPLVGGVFLVALALVLATAWLSFMTGRLLHRLARGPAALLAARRLTADPWQGSRVHGALLTAVMVAGGSAAFRALFVARRDAYRAADEALARATGSTHVHEPDHFYLDAMNLVDAAVVVALVIAAAGVLVALAQAVTARRRTHAALVAAGVPRGVLGRSVLWQTVVPLLPALVLALAVGAALGRAFGTEVRAFGGSARTGGRTVRLPDVVRAVPVPWGELVLYGAGALALVLAAVGLSALVMRRGTSVEELRAG
jgi:hypothetical protein